ncbi:MAG: hypothetical protein A2Y15_05635 [Clostridiales bacterium GWF2_36_10]|nr:MAG: hypothetical protein A2Y15_05635 [Clostridiales bacterium GWF2_36_10]HAN21975.1 hypothetical protein [Clostridiales bacterium]
MANVTSLNKFLGLNQVKKIDDDISYSPDMANFKITENFSLKKRGGICKVFNSTGDLIEGMWSGYLGVTYYFLFASNGCLYNFNLTSGVSSLIGSIGYGKNVMFEFSGKLYILNGSMYSCFDGSSVVAVEGYVPLIAIGCNALGAGTTYEDLNLLSNKRRQQYSADGTSSNYLLAEQNINQINYIMINRVPFIDFTCNYTTGSVHFNSVPPQGLNNIEICYIKNNLDRTRITKNCYAMLFGGNVDGRLFLWGHPDYPNYRFHSELANGVPSVEYFPENNFTVIGNTEITDIVSQYDRQLIFTKDRAFYSFCELREDTLGNYYSSFPVYNLNGEKGNLIKGSCCIVGNDPITFCNDGLNRWSSTTVENERNAICFSSPISTTVANIVKENNFSDLRIFDFQTGSELLFYHREKAFIYNYKLGVWYVYNDILCDIFCDCRGVLYFSYADTIYKLDESVNDDDNMGVTAYWKSPFFSAGEPYMRKDINELSVTVETIESTMLDLTVNSDLNPNNIFLESFWITNSSGKKISCLRIRPNVRRVAKVQIYLRTTGSDTDAEIHELALVSKKKGRNARYGL